MKLARLRGAGGGAPLGTLSTSRGSYLERNRRRAPRLLAKAVPLDLILMSEVRSAPRGWSQCDIRSTPNIIPVLFGAYNSTAGLHHAGFSHSFISAVPIPCCSRSLLKCSAKPRCSYQNLKVSRDLWKDIVKIPMPRIPIRQSRMGLMWLESL